MCVCVCVCVCLSLSRSLSHPIALSLALSFTRSLVLSLSLSLFSLSLALALALALSAPWSKNATPHSLFCVSSIEHATARIRVAVPPVPCRPWSVLAFLYFFFWFRSLLPQVRVVRHRRRPLSVAYLNPKPSRAHTYTAFTRTHIHHKPLTLTNKTHITRAPTHKNSLTHHSHKHSKKHATHTRTPATSSFRIFTISFCCFASSPAHKEKKENKKKSQQYEH